MILVISPTPSLDYRLDMILISGGLQEIEIKSRENKSVEIIRKFGSRYSWAKEKLKSTSFLNYCKVWLSTKQHFKSK